MLALSRDHAENPVEVYIVQAIEAHNLCNFGAISSKQWKVRAFLFESLVFMLANYVMFLNPCVSFEGATTIFYVLWGTLDIFRWAACLQREIPTEVQLLPHYRLQET